MSRLLIDGGQFDRRALVRRLLQHRDEVLVVAGLGAAAWDLAAIGDRSSNFYLWGGMGLACSIGLGLALVRPTRRILVLTGDGEMMMGIGSLAAIANAAPANLSILVLDNQAFGETGRQTGLTAGPTDIAAMAAGAGLPIVMTATGAADLVPLAELLFAGEGPVLAVARIALADHPLVLPPKNGAILAERCRRALDVEGR